MMLYTILSRLLDYPSQELFDHLSEVQTALAESGADATERVQIEAFLDYLDERGLIAMQQDYVQTFDMVPEHSLHLTHHLFGDDRGRGPALVDLGEHYKGMGMAVSNGELPDYLPLILEYVATLDGMAARVFLADARKVLTVLAANLERSGSAYAPLVRIAENRGHLANAA